MKPEDVKPITEIEKLIMVEGFLPARNPDSSWSLEGSGSIVPCIPAHEVGAIIKTAISAGQCYGWLKAFEFTEEQENATRAAHRAWLAKADELEKMK